MGLKLDYKFGLNGPIRWMSDTLTYQPPVAKERTTLPMMSEHAHLWKILTSAIFDSHQCRRFKYNASPDQPLCRQLLLTEILNK